ncbi:MAG TPA: hypothetical protein VL155_04740 [Terriglobales bacterium]|jgi:hypothetical protein|nr:hypothetical protein [Terriglobales bacterium]
MKMTEDPAINSLADFRTDSLALAAYIVAAKLLPLATIEIDPSRRFASFVFRDLAHRGSELQAQFLSGQAMVDANLYHHQLRTLRREIDDRLSRGGNTGQIQDSGASNGKRQR